MFCPNCGNRVDDSDKFCVFCGYPLDLLEENTDEEVQPDQAGESVHESPVEMTSELTDKSVQESGTETVAEPTHTMIGQIEPEQVAEPDKEELQD